METYSSGLLTTGIEEGYAQINKDSITWLVYVQGTESPEIRIKLKLEMLMTP